MRLESFHAELLDISIGQHNDRVATLQTGIQLYEDLMFFGEQFSPFSSL